MRWTAFRPTEHSLKDTATHGTKSCLRRKPLIGNLTQSDKPKKLRNYKTFNGGLAYVLATEHMNIEEVKVKMKEIEKNAVAHPERKEILRLQWRSLKATLDLYYREHPQGKLTIDN